MIRSVRPNGWMTVRERALSIGYVLGDNECWKVGDIVRDAWVRDCGEEPKKPLMPKAFGRGTHHIAVYPPRFFQVIDQAVHDVASGGGQSLFWFMSNG